MRFDSWIRTLNSAAQGTPSRRRRQPGRRVPDSFRPTVEGLEIRLAPALLVGTGVTASIGVGEVLRYNETNAALIDHFVPPGGSLNLPRGAAFGPDGNLYLADVQGNVIKRYDGTTGAFLNNFATISQPEHLVFHAGSLFVTSFDAIGSVQRFNATTGAFIPSAGGGLTFGDGLKVGPGGNLYAVSVGSGAGQILRYDGTTGALLGVFIASGGTQPRDIAFGPDGNAYVTDLANNTILKFDGSTGAFISTFVSGASAPVGPRDLVFDAAGNLYVASSGSGQVLEYNSAGTLVRVVASGLNSPNSLLLYDIPPTVHANTGSVTVNEGSQGTVTGTYGDLDGPNVTLTASVGNVTKTGPTTWTWTDTPTDGPAQSGVVTITANDGAGGIATTTFSLNVENVSPVATLSNNGPVTYGSPVTVSFSGPFDPSNNDTAAGFHYAFTTNPAALASATYASSGSSASQALTLPAGNYTIYGGIIDKDDGFTQYSTSFSVAAADTSTSVTSSVAHPVFGQPVSFTAAVTTAAPGAGTPAGSVQFAIDGTPFGLPATLSGGTATSDITTSLAVGPHTITATYSGNTNFNASVGSSSAATGGFISTVNGTNGGAFFVPLVVASDAAGDLYVGDAAKSIVAKVDTAGNLTIVAGVPFAFGNDGDGGPATSAHIGAPSGLAVDAAGNLYIADNANQVVRKVDALTGIITTVAGTGSFGVGGEGVPAASAPLSSPAGLAVDSAGNLFIAESLNNRVRKVDAFGNISTVAGDVIGTVFSGPIGLARDAAGNLYVADTNNNRVAKVDPLGNVTTVAGNGTFTDSGDGGPATDAGVTLPFGVTVDPAGNLYISDVIDNVIRKVDGAGIITTVAGTGAADYTGDGGLGTAATLSAPQALASDAAGNVYVADVNNHVIRQITASAAGFAVAPASTATTVVSSGSPAVWGDSVTFTATISAVAPGAGLPTGTVTFMDGFATLGTGLLHIVGGLDQASFSTSALEVSGHSITAVYNGDGNYLPSTSSVFNQVVLKATPLVTWDNPADIFYGTALGAAQLDATASVSGSFAYAPEAGTVLHAGTGQDLDAVFTPDDTTHYKSVNRSVSINVLKASLTVSADSKTKVYGEGVPALTASYSGFVNFDSAGVLGGTPALSTTATQFSVPGPYTISIGLGSLTSSDYEFHLVGGTLTVNQAFTTTGGSVSPAAPLVGLDTVTFTAQVTVNPPGAGGPTGTVHFFDTTTSVDLGTVSLVGGSASLNTATLGLGTHNVLITYSGDGNFSGSSISAAVTVKAPASLSGLVYNDFNNNGQVDFGEPGIPNVTVHLTGTDDLNHAVDRTVLTDHDGAYAFLTLRPGNYSIQETQPAGYTQGLNTLGTAGGSLGAIDQFFVTVGDGGVNGMHYNYGERPLATGPVQRGQTAGIGFWHNKNGQALILALNAGPTDTHLANWLAVSFPHTFGTLAGANNLTGKTNADVAAVFLVDFMQKGPKLDAQLLATALAVYVTDPNLDTTGVGHSYGFTVSGNGVGTATVNVGSNGAAFGVANNSTLTVMNLLLAADHFAVSGVLYGGSTTLRNQANNVFGAINDASGI